jgi:hypothetical protein
MSLNRGKRRRRDRRRRDDDDVVQTEEMEQPSSAAPKRTPRARKSMAERSPLLPAGLAVVCLFGAIFTAIVYKGSPKIGLLWGVFYLFLAAVEAYLAYRIYRARGGWR